MKVSKKIQGLAATLILGAASAAHGNVFITEYMYNGNGAGSLGEFVQITNTGPNPQDMTGWSFDDSSETAGSQPLNGLGTLAVGQIGILTDMTASDFISDWNLDPSVKVVGGNSNNLGRPDEINIYDNTNTLVDRLTYNDQATPAGSGGPRTNSTSAYILPANYGANAANLAVLATAGDAFGSRTSTLGELGNPGPAVAPEPASLGLLAVAGLFIRRNRRRRA